MRATDVLRRGLCLLGLCAVLVSSSAQEENGRAERATRAARPPERLRERMHALPAGERARLERNLEEYEKLTPQARARLLVRARALRERERSADTAVPGELQRKMAGLDSERARELWGAHLRERFREHGRELRARLPENLRRRLEQAPPETRRRFLERLFRERERVSRQALTRMHERYGLSGGEIQRLERLPLEERLHAMLVLDEGTRARVDR